MVNVKKDEFADLDQDWKDSIVSMSKEEVNSKIAEIAKANEELQKAKKEDEDLQEAKLAAKEAGEIYRSSAKMSKLRIQYCIRVLDDRGVE